MTSMRVNQRVVSAVFKRDFFAYLTNPTGYVFITIFVFMSAIAAFWPKRFFLDNLANLAHLNELMPYMLLVFVPAITMNSWAGERREGTDELLLTLPATDLEVVVGKYLATLGIYTVSLAFALSHIFVLAWLGSPDLGVMFGTYLGYWLMGATLLALGLVASALTSNATVGFIIGAAFSAVLVFADKAGEFFFTGRAARFFEWLSVPGQFEPFGEGRFLFSAFAYFVGLAAVFLFANVVLVGRRHWIVRSAGTMGTHMAVRVMAVLVTAVSISGLFHALGWGGDLTAERLHSLSPQTRAVIRALDGENPVYVEAFISPKVPQSYVETRQVLTSMLREFDRMGGSAIRLVIHETEKYTPEARAAVDNFGLRPQAVRGDEGGVEEIFLGVAFRCGAEEDVINLDRGLNVEYELTRSIRVVARTRRKTIGVMETDAKINGGFDMQTFQRQPKWSIVGELERQYKIKSIAADSPVPDDVDAVLVVLPSSLTQPQIDNLQSWVLSGGPTLMVVDPMTFFNLGLSPSQPRGGQSNPFQRQQQPKEPKGSLAKLFDKLGVVWQKDEVVWQMYNPHPEFPDLDHEFVFISPGSGQPEAFNSEHPTTSGLQELLFMFGGCISKRSDAKTTFTPLLKTSAKSGTKRFSDLTTRSFFGLQFNPDTGVHYASDETYTVAAEIKGAPIVDDAKPKDEEGEGEATAPTRRFNELHTIILCDIDGIGEQFFQIRRQGLRNLEFDNVTFALNCMDTLLGEDAFIELRKKRVKHRTLTALEKETQTFEESLGDEEKKANDRAEKRKEQAQKDFDAKIDEITKREDLDRLAKQRLIETVRDVETRRLEIAKAKIDEDKKAAVQDARARREIALREIRSRVRLAAVLIPPLPALLLAVIIFWIRSQREIGSASNRRLV